MKYYLLLFTALLLSVEMLNGQISIGLRTGYTRSWPDYGSVPFPEGAITGVDGNNISLMVQTKLGKSMWTLGIEPGITKRGARCIPGWQPNFRGDSKIVLSMAELPIMVGTTVKLS